MSTNTLSHFPRLGLGDACRLFGLTPRALRFYEERGLVTAKRDRLNCRYYDGAQRERLAWIARLRAAGVSLPAIRDVLDAGGESGSREAALAKLQDRAARVRADLAEVEAVMAALSADSAPRGVAARL
jgi:DNA-binding transcriptional MerR regulator